MARAVEVIEDWHDVCVDVEWLESVVRRFHANRPEGREIECEHCQWSER